MHSSCTPPRNRIEMTTVAKPGTGARPIFWNQFAKRRYTSVNATPRAEIVEIKSPR